MTMLPLGAAPSHLDGDELLKFICFLVEQLGGGVSLDSVEVMRIFNNEPRKILEVFEVKDPYRLTFKVRTENDQ